MDALERRLKQVTSSAAKLVITDALYSMDEDIIDLSRLVEVRQKYNCWLMIDEADSVGVLGKTGRGIEEHFGMKGTIDILVGTLSKTISSIG